MTQTSESQLPQMPDTREFTILDEKAEHQILLISMPPASIVYVTGVRLFSSADIKVTSAIGRGWFSPKNQTRLAVNDSPSFQIMGLKHPLKQGRVLVLDLAIYRDSFYFSGESLLACRKPLENRSKHPLLPLLLAEHSEKSRSILDVLDINQDTIVLQAESSILEKTLAKEECFWVQRDALLAISKSITVELAKDEEVKLKGPGWVFFQTHSLEPQRKRTKSNMKAVLGLFLLIAILELLLALFI